MKGGVGLKSLPKGTGKERKNLFGNGSKNRKFVIYQVFQIQILFILSLEEFFE